MKGGVASVVVYPGLIWQLRERWEFRSIGGASAGAIGAGLAYAYQIAATKECQAENGQAEEAWAALKAELNSLGLTRGKDQEGELILPEAKDAARMNKVQQFLRGPQASPDMRLLQLCFHVVHRDNLIPDMLKPSNHTILQGLAWWAFRISQTVSQRRIYFTAILPFAILLIGAAAIGWQCGGLRSLAFLGGSTLLLSLLLIIGVVAARLVGSWTLGPARGEPTHLSSLKSPGEARKDELIDNFLGLRVDPKITSGTSRVADMRLTDWLQWWIQYLAYGEEALCHPPLSARPGGHLKVVSTNLSLGEPETFPSDEVTYYASRQEFEQLFPEPLLKVLLTTPYNSIPKNALDFLGNTRVPDDLYALPRELPVAFLCRISLSFPPVLRPIRLWKPGAKLRSPSASEPLWTECIISDGGISSNFPVNMFDDWVPEWPTFGVNLLTVDEHTSIRAYPTTEARDANLASLKGTEEEQAEVDRLVDTFRVPERKSFDAGSTWTAISSSLSFLENLFLTAQNWRDNMQARLIGYRERVVEVWLNPHEGGLNLWMDLPCRLAVLNKGIRAGKRFNNFCLETHRRLRLHQLNTLLEERRENLNRFLNGESTDTRQNLCQLLEQATHKFGTEVSHKESKTTPANVSVVPTY